AGVQNGVCHTFTTEGPNKGEFTTTLTVTTHFGCTETFSFNASATNLILKPVIIADKDSACINDAEFSFKLKDGPITQAFNPVYTFELPRNSANVTRDWKARHRFSGVGPYQVTFGFTHSIPGCSDTITDTVMVIGPLSVIEGPAPLQWLNPSERYQCVIKDSVHFNNFSIFYHNDRNMMDDDSLLVV